MNPYRAPEPRKTEYQQISDGVIWIIFLAGWFLGSCITIYSNREMNKNAYRQGLEDGRVEMVEDFLIIPRSSNPPLYDQ